MITKQPIIKRKCSKMSEEQKNMAIQQYKDKIKDLEAKVYAQATTMISMQEDINLLREEKNLAFQTTNNLSKENEQLKKALEGLQAEVTALYKGTKDINDAFPTVKNTAQVNVLKIVLDKIDRYVEGRNNDEAEN